MVIKRKVHTHLGIMAFVAFEQKIVMYQRFVKHVCPTLAAGASARRINSLLMPGIGLKE